MRLSFLVLAIAWLSPCADAQVQRTVPDGVTNVDKPWIVSSVFAGMVAVLLLITFVGEAIREAFDPKKFTTYR